MSGDVFYVQCISGIRYHTMEAVPGSELEERCKKRVEAGYLDALCLGYEECPECIEDRRTQDAELFVLCGCPLENIAGICDDDCSCKSSAEIAVSPYAGQVRGISTTA